MPQVQLRPSTEALRALLAAKLRAKTLAVRV